MRELTVKQANEIHVKIVKISQTLLVATMNDLFARLKSYSAVLTIRR